MDWEKIKKTGIDIGTKLGSGLFHGAHKLLAKKVGDPQEALYANKPQSQAMQFNPSAMNNPGLSVQSETKKPKMGPLYNVGKLATQVLSARVPKVVQQPVQAAPTPTEMPRMPVEVTHMPQSTGEYTRDEYEQAIKEGFKNWGSPPAATLSGEMASYIDKYPVYKKHPFLLPALHLLETSGGAKTKRPNNFTNWGVYLKDYNPENPVVNLERTATGIAERSPYYKDFRETMDLNDLGRVYAPESDNPGTGGENYAKNAEQIMNVFRSKLKKK